MVIDFHTHCFPEKIASKAMNMLSHEAAIMPEADGTVNGLLASMEDSGVDLSVVLSIATNEKQQKSVNDFAYSINGDKIVAFGSVYPDSPDVMEELERIKELGLKGVKLHPEYQGFYVDDEKMKPIYKKISSLGLITVFHAGADYGYAPPYHATPERMKKALCWFDSVVVAAHFGGLSYGEEVIKHLCGLPIYFDTAYSYGAMSKYNAQTIIEKHTAEKILFASDSPWHKPKMEKFMIETLGLSEEEKKQIYYKNAVKLLNLTNITED